MSPSPGKLRGLQQCSTPEGIFTILALDHSPDYFLDQAAGYSDIVSVKEGYIASLSELASAVLLDPGYGLPAAVYKQALPGRTGLLLSAEDGTYQDPAKEDRAKLLDGWSVEKIKRAGAAAVKLFFYYHPDHSARAADEERFVSEVAAECRKHDIPLFAEPLSYATAPEERPRVVIETARRISALDIDVLKVEFPVDSNRNKDEAHWREACEALDAACRTPWALLSAGVSYEIFNRQVEIACRAGASGFLAGRAIWGEAKGLPDLEQESFLRETASARLQSLASIAADFGRPWQQVFRQKFSLPDDGWYAHYGENP